MPLVRMASHLPHETDTDGVISSLAVMLAVKATLQQFTRATLAS
jgi:hypothetical protein